MLSDEQLQDAKRELIDKLAVELEYDMRSGKLTFMLRHDGEEIDRDYVYIK